VPSATSISCMTRVPSGRRLRGSRTDRVSTQRPRSATQCNVLPRLATEPSRVYDFVDRVIGRLYGVEMQLHSAEPTREQRFIDFGVNNGISADRHGSHSGETVVSATKAHLESSGGPGPVEAEGGQ
jgi:hypothetical protein